MYSRAQVKVLIHETLDQYFKDKADGYTFHISEITDLIPSGWGMTSNSTASLLKTRDDCISYRSMGKCNTKNSGMWEYRSKNHENKY